MRLSLSFILKSIVAVVLLGGVYYSFSSYSDKIALVEGQNKALLHNYKEMLVYNARLQDIINKRPAFPKKKIKTEDDAKKEMIDRKQDDLKNNKKSFEKKQENAKKISEKECSKDNKDKHCKEYKKEVNEILNQQKQAFDEGLHAKTPKQAIDANKKRKSSILRTFKNIKKIQGDIKSLQNEFNKYCDNKKNTPRCNSIKNDIKKLNIWLSAFSEIQKANKDLEPLKGLEKLLKSCGRVVAAYYTSGASEAVFAGSKQGNIGDSIMGCLEVLFSFGKGEGDGKEKGEGGGKPNTPQGGGEDSSLPLGKPNLVEIPSQDPNPVDEETKAELEVDKGLGGSAGFAECTNPDDPSKCSYEIVITNKELIINDLNSGKKIGFLKISDIPDAHSKLKEQGWKVYAIGEKDDLLVLSLKKENDDCHLKFKRDGIIFDNGCKTPNL